LSNLPDKTPPETPSPKAIENLKLSILNEIHLQIMAVLFLLSLFTIVFYFNRTVITVLAASQLFCLIGLVGFFGAYLLRDRLRLSLLDGLFYNLFGIAPLVVALVLFINASCSETFVETYDIENMEQGGSGYTYTLENNAYGSYWHIRNLDRDEANNRYGRLQFTFCKGLFGMKVVKERKLVK
jgi:hypothetical protein